MGRLPSPPLIDTGHMQAARDRSRAGVGKDLQVSHWCLCCHIRHSAETGGNVAAVPDQQPSYSNQVPRELQGPQKSYGRTCAFLKSMLVAAERTTC